MLGKSLKGFLFVLLAVVLLCSSSAPVFAASALVDDSGGKASGKQGGDYELERDLDGGIHLVVDGIGKNKDDDIYIRLTITSEEDVVIEIATKDAEIFDAKNGRATPRRDDWAVVADTANRREIIGGIPVTGLVFYDSPDKYELTDFYPRVSFTFNGKKLTFRNVPALK
jgi:hypothetical protein